MIVQVDVLILAMAGVKAAVERGVRWVVGRIAIKIAKKVANRLVMVQIKKTRVAIAMIPVEEDAHVLAKMVAT